MGRIRQGRDTIAAPFPSWDVTWEKAEIGDFVCLQMPGWPPQHGLVQDKTANGDIVWVISAGERRLVHVGDGCSLTVIG